MSDPNAAPGLDFTIDVNPDAKPFEAVDDGTYIAVVNEGDVSSVHKPGSDFPYFKVAHTIIKPDEFTGRKVFQNYSMKPEAQFRLRELIEATLGRWGGFKWPEVYGKPHSIIVKKEEFDGRPTNKIRRVGPVA